MLVCTVLLARVCCSGGMFVLFCWRLFCCANAEMWESLCEHTCGTRLRCSSDVWHPLLAVQRMHSFSPM